MIGGGVAFIFILTYVLSIYYPIPSAEEEQIIDIVDSSSITANVAVSNNTESVENVKPFMLGSQTFTNSAEEEVSVDLKGKIAIPTVEGELPIVFIIPSQSSSVYDTNDYEVILSEIAKKNCVAIYLDLAELLTNEQQDMNLVKQVFNAYRDELNAIILGEKTTASLDLVNKASFSKVIMIGFEESVEAIYGISEDQLSQQQLNLESILLINPKKTEEAIYSYPDVLTSFLIDSSLTDVESLSSLKLFEEYRQEKARQSLTSYTLIESDYESCVTEDENSQNQLDEQASTKQEPDTKFLTQFIGDFLSATFDSESENPIFSVTTALPDTLYQKKVRSALIVPNTLRLINPFIEEKATLNTLGGNNEVNNLKMEHETGDVSIFRLSLEETPATLSIEIPEEFKNLSQYDNISMYMSVCTNNDSSTTQSTEISMVLTDETGQSSTVTETAIISPCDAKHGYHLSDERFVLSQFTGIDLNAISEIKIELTDQSIKTIVLGDLSLVKKPKE